MPSDVASTLSSAIADRYRVIRELGAGGMATVYLAHDLRHERDVAIKVLHPDLGVALGADRFLAEIKVTARLQHPHVLPLIDSGAADGLLYYVMPLVTGESLRTRLAREKQLPIDVALRLASEVADALHHAHSLGVIHRDIKPENILLQGGHAVVADFGIALAVEAAAGARMTQTGLSLGTPQYMSPEQAMGERTIDARSDIYALGAMTYEMLTGDPPFMGTTVQAIVAKVLTERPTPPTHIRDTIPAHVESVVLRALAKLPADRFATAADFGAALNAYSHSGGAYLPGATPFRMATQATHRRRWIAWALCAAGVAAAAAVVGRLAIPQHSTNDAGAPARVRFELALPDSFTAAEVYPFPAAVSPDGSEFVFAAQVRGRPVRLFRRRMDKLDVTPLPADFTEANQPIYSPDGKWLAAEGDASHRLRKVRLSDGEIVEICACSAALGGDWGDQGEIVLGFEGRHRGLSHVNANGGVPAPLTQTPKGDSVTTHIYPIFAGSSDVIVFSISGRGLNSTELAATSLHDGTVTPLGVKGVRALAVRRDRIIYSRADGVMMSVPFDASTRKVTGAPTPVPDALVVGYNQNGNAPLALGRNGGMVVLERHYYSYAGWVRGNDTPTLLSHEMREYHQSPKLSPDGTRIVAQIGDLTASQIWVISLATGAMTRLSTARWSSGPQWTPDGRSIIYLAADGDSLNIVRQSADGGGSPVTLAALEFHSLSPFASPDGSAAVYRAERSGNNDVRVISLRDGLRAHGRPFVATQANEWPAAFSPNGRWVAVYSDESGRYELSVRSFPDPVQRLTASSDGISDKPFWSRDGRVLYYLNESSALVALHLSEDSTLRIVSREIVRNAPARPGADTSDAALLHALPAPVRFVPGDISADGRMLGSVGTVVRNRLIVEPNWRP